MRFLKVAVVVMGVLIVLGTTTLVVVIIHRLSAAPTGAAPAGAPGAAMIAASGTASGAPTGAAALDEPAGTRITAMARVANGLALSLSGGGEGDRVVVIDPASGRVVERIGLGRMGPGH
jgi:hypothetical protein